MRHPVLEVPDEQFYPWLAGFIDGEGCFSISKTRFPGNRIGWKMSACLQISQSDKGFIEALRERLGSGRIAARETTGLMAERYNCRTCYSLMLTCVQARIVTEKIYPYLILKKEQAELLLRFQTLVKRRGGGKFRSDEYWATQDTMHTSMKAMKRTDSMPVDTPKAVLTLC